MNTIEDYIIVENTIPKELCKELINECNKKEWKKHTWNNYATGTFTSETVCSVSVSSDIPSSVSTNSFG